MTVALHDFLWNIDSTSLTCLSILTDLGNEDKMDGIDL